MGADSRRRPVMQRRPQGEPQEWKQARRLVAIHRPMRRTWRDQCRTFAASVKVVRPPRGMQCRDTVQTTLTNCEYIEVEQGLKKRICRVCAEQLKSYVACCAGVDGNHYGQQRVGSWLLPLRVDPEYSRSMHCSEAPTGRQASRRRPSSPFACPSSSTG